MKKHQTETMEAQVIALLADGADWTASEVSRATGWGYAYAAEILAMLPDLKHGPIILSDDSTCEPIYWNHQARMTAMEKIGNKTWQSDPLHNREPVLKSSSAYAEAIAHTLAKLAPTNEDMPAIFPWLI